MIKSQDKLVANLTAQLQRALPLEPLTRLVNLAAVALGILRSKSRQVGQIITVLPLEGTARSIEEGRRIMANVIIGIHGLANKPNREDEAKWWEKSIREGLKKTCGIDSAKFTYHMVYWADLLYKYPLHDDANFTFDALYNNEPYIEAKPRALKKYEEGWLDAAREAVLGAEGAALDALKGYVGMDTLANNLLEKTLKDLAFYYEPGRQIRDRSGQMQQVKLALKGELKSKLHELHGQRIMLIAHSMGSIIAYDMLRDLGQEDPTFELAHFVTIGSPLGLPHVKMKVHEERSGRGAPVRTPSVVTEKWINYADRRDPVAVDVHLADDYGPNDRKVQVEDNLVLNDYPLPEDKPNHHKSYGYLRTPELSEHIRQFMVG